MDFDLCDKLNEGKVTFCFALFFLRVSFDTILMAEIFLVYRF